MAKTQGNVGASLAAVYDVEGGKLAGSADLLDREILQVHELGAQIFAEHMNTAVRTINSAATAASTAFDTVIADVAEIARLTSWLVFVDTTARLAHVTLSIDSTEGASIPLFAWDSATGTEATLRFNVGGTVANRIVLIPGAAMAALLPVRSVTGGRRAFSRLALRGVTTAFGAGALITSAIIGLNFFARTDQLFPGAAVLPYPSW